MMRSRGFTLLELLITVAIAAILSAIAYPSFVESIRKGRRADAVEFMTKVQQAEEQWRANNSFYTTDLSSTGLKVASVTSDAPSSKGYYTVSVTVPGATSGSAYTIIAKATGAQAADVKCASMSIAVAGGQITYDSTSGQACWAK